MQNTTDLPPGGGCRLKRGKAWAFGCFFTVTSSLAAPVGAVTINYDAIVDASSGPLADAFPTGAMLEISYTLDRDVEDSDSDPMHGIFHGAVQSLSIALPEVGVSVIAGPLGHAAIFDNVANEVGGEASDQVFIVGGPISSANLTGGETITELELEFFSDSVAPPDDPMMIDSDALTTSKLRFTNAFVYLRTAGEPTVLKFSEESSSVSDDGCAIGQNERSGRLDAWLLVVPAVPALLLWARRRQKRRRAR